MLQRISVTPVRSGSHENRILDHMTTGTVDHITGIRIEGENVNETGSTPVVNYQNESKPYIRQLDK